MTELRESILRNQIGRLDELANKLEEVVYFQLAGLPDDQEEMDSRVLMNLKKLDEYQEEIDELTVKLKAEESWKPASYSEAKYIYTKPKAKPKPKPEPKKPRKVYSSETTEQRKRREAAAEKAVQREAQKVARKAAREAQRAAVAAEKQRLKEERRAEREALRKDSKPVKTTLSAEVIVLRNRRNTQHSRMKALEKRFEPKRLELEGRVRYFEEKLIELADVSWTDRGHQKRHKANEGLQNAQKQLEELPATFEAKRKKFEEQLAELDQEITDQIAKEAS